MARNVIQGSESLKGPCLGSNDQNHGQRYCTENGSFDSEPHTSPRIQRFGLWGFMGGSTRFESSEHDVCPNSLGGYRSTFRPNPARGATSPPPTPRDGACHA